MATSLGKVGIRNRGRFDASATYAAGEFVYYMGSTFIALQNLPAGMVPQHDGINWNFLAEGASVEQVLQNFAPIEDGATVSKAYSAGDFFLHEDVLYKATTDIASGGAIIIGTNVIQANIGEEMHALAKNFANEEDSATATINYSVGQYVIYNEQFYKVTAAISAGQTLVPGTNIEATNVGAQLSALSDSLANKFKYYNTESRADFYNAVKANGYQLFAASQSFANTFTDGKVNSAITGYVVYNNMADAVEGMFYQNQTRRMYSFRAFASLIDKLNYVDTTTL